MRKLALSEVILLHLIPGLFFTLAIGIVSFLVPTTIVPRFLIFAILGIGILAPVELGIIEYHKRRNKSEKFVDLHPETEKANWKETALFSAVSVFWAIIIFAALGPSVNTYMKEENIHIGIATHVFLNVVGDFLLVIPLIFN